MSKRLLRRQEVEVKVGICCSTIYDRMAEGTFPRPKPIGGGKVRWLESDVDEWIDCISAGVEWRPKGTCEMQGQQ